MKRSFVASLLSVAAILACSQTGQLGDAQAGKTRESTQAPAQVGKKGQVTAPSVNDDDKLSDTDSADAGKPVIPAKKTDSKPATSPSTKPSTTPSAASSDSNVVRFTIPAGTGRGPWNTRDNPIKARVGQTLEITNGDSTQHWVHTNFSPFVHPFSGIAPGQKASYRLNSANAAGMHDHLTNGAIFMQISQ